MEHVLSAVGALFSVPLCPASAFARVADCGGRVLLVHRLALATNNGVYSFEHCFHCLLVCHCHCLELRLVLLL